MNRRELFLSGLGLILMPPPDIFAKITHSQNTLQSNPLFLIGHGFDKYKQAGPVITTTSSDAELRIVNISGEENVIQTPCRGHEIGVNPQNPNIVFIPSKWGREACLADLKSKKLLKTFLSDHQFNFYGHSVFTSDGKYILVSMANVNDGEGFISVRDSSTLIEVKRFPTFGKKPHQVSWWTQDKIIAAINAHPSANSSLASLNLIDVKSSKLMRAYKLNHQGHSHFIFNEDKGHVLAGRHIEQGEQAVAEFIDTRTGSVSTCNELSKKTLEPTEVLGLAINQERHIACIGITGAKKIIFWDYKYNKILHQENLESNPLGFGISKNKKFVYICIGKKNGGKESIRIYDYNKFFSFDFKNYLKEINSGNGSHLTITQG